MNLETIAPEMEKKKWSPGWLYILDYGDSKRFKIGITSVDPKIRIDAITRNSGMLLPNPIDAKLVVTLYMESNPYYLEQLLHMHLVDSHVTGEWFEFESFVQVCELIDGIRMFGTLDYYERWYDIIPKDILLWIANNVVPDSLDYIKCASYNVGRNLVKIHSRKQTRKEYLELKKYTNNQLNKHKDSFICEIKFID